MIAASSTAINGVVTLPVPLRAAPSSTVDFANLSINDGYAFGTAVSSITLGESSTTAIRIAGVVSGATTGRWHRLEANNSTSADLGFSAEL